MPIINLNTNTSVITSQEVHPGAVYDAKTKLPKNQSINSKRLRK